jgi:hypothetical protein
LVNLPGDQHLELAWVATSGFALYGPVWKQRIATKSHFHRDNYDLFSDQPILSDVGCFLSLRNKNFGEWNLDCDLDCGVFFVRFSYCSDDLHCKAGVWRTGFAGQGTFFTCWKNTEGLSPGWDVERMERLKLGCPNILLRIGHHLSLNHANLGQLLSHPCHALLRS